MSSLNQDFLPTFFIDLRCTANGKEFEHICGRVAIYLKEVLYLWMCIAAHRRESLVLRTKGRRVYRMPSKWPFSQPCDHHFNTKNGR